MRRRQMSPLGLFMRIDFLIEKILRKSQRKDNALHEPQQDAPAPIVEADKIQSGINVPNAPQVLCTNDMTETKYCPS